MLMPAHPKMYFCERIRGSGETMKPNPSLNPTGASGAHSLRSCSRGPAG